MPNRIYLHVNYTPLGYLNWNLKNENKDNFFKIVTDLSKFGVKFTNIGRNSVDQVVGLAGTISRTKTRYDPTDQSKSPSNQK